MALFTRKTKRHTLRQSKLRRMHLLRDAQMQAHTAGLLPALTKDGAVLIATRDHRTHILVDPQINRRGQLVPKITVMSEVEDPDLAGDSHIVELHTMAQSPEDQLMHLIQQLRDEEPINNATRVA